MRFGLECESFANAVFDRVAFGGMLQPDIVGESLFSFSLFWIPLVQVSNADV